MTNDNDMPELPPVHLHPDFGDPSMLLNMRDWLQKACEQAGAKMTGGGVGMGEADIDLVLEGNSFNVSIRPIISAGPE